MGKCRPLYEKGLGVRRIKQKQLWLIQKVSIMNLAYCQNGTWTKIS